MSSGDEPAPPGVGIFPRGDGGFLNLTEDGRVQAISEAGHVLCIDPSHQDGLFLKPEGDAVGGPRIRRTEEGVYVGGIFVRYRDQDSSGRS